MATTWQAVPSMVQYGASDTTIYITGLGSNETLDLKVTNPSGETFKWTVVADEDGTVSKELILASGIGTYKISLWQDTCTAEQLCYELEDLVIVAQKCKVAEAHEQLQLFANKLYLAVGEMVELTVVGIPNSVAIISQLWAGGVIPKHVELNSEGVGFISLSTMSMTDSFVAVNNTNVSNTVVIHVPADINTPALVVDTGSELRFSVVPSVLAIEQGVAFALTLQVQNTADNLVRVSITNASGALQQDVPVHLQLEPIAAGGTREFTFFFSGMHNNQDATSMSVTFVGTYLKSDNTTVPWSYSASVLMPPRKLDAALMVTSFLIEPASITLGDSAKITVEVTNVGEADINNLELYPLVFDNVAGQIGFNGVPLPRGAKYSTSAIIKPTAVDTYVFVMDGSLISGTAQGMPVIGTNELTTSLLVMQK